MRHPELNEVLRMVFEQLEKEGYKRRDLCNLTLGNQCGPMFSGFVKGTDLGLKPLSRIIDAFGYELHVVPVPKNFIDPMDAATLEKMSNSFTENCKMAMIENLDNQDNVEKARNKVSGVFKDIANDLLAEVLKD